MFHPFVPLLVALLLLCPCKANAAQPSSWKVGLASTVITPKEAVWLCGYSNRTRPAEGKVHDLYAKVFALEDSTGTRLVLVTLDLGSVSEAITESVHRKIHPTYKLPRASLILNVSHTHCAPEVAAERLVFHDLPANEEAKLVRYIAWLEDQIAVAVNTALADLRPARLSLGTGSAGFASNRRLPTPGGFINSQNREGPVDHEVPVLRVTGLDGQLRGILFGYACHNTTLAFQLYCGDYAGFAQQFLEEANPGVKALFVMGCGGDQNPYPRHGASGLDHARQHGKSLADAAQKALKGSQKEVTGNLRIGYEVVTLGLEPLPPRPRLEAEAKGSPGLAQRKARYLLNRLEREGRIDLIQTCPLHAAKLGDDLLFVAVSGETVLDYARICKREFAGPYVWVAGYNDDVFAYLPSLRVLREGGYEGREGIIHQLTPTPFLATVEERVMGGIRRLATQVGARRTPVPLKVITLGDSITKGVRPGVKAEETFASLLQESLQKDGIVTVVSNVGIGGEDTVRALARLDRDVIAHKPDVVTIMYGTNDSYVDKGKTTNRISLEDYKANLGKLVERLRAAGIQPVLMTEPRLGDRHGPNGRGEHPNKPLEEYVKACRDVARQLRVPLVDHFAHWSERNSSGMDVGKWTTDECHPNPEGHRVMMTLLRSTVKDCVSPR